MTNNIKEDIEDKVIDCINLGISGRMIVYKPEKGIFGEDLAVERRGDYKEKPMLFRVISAIGPNKEKSFIKYFSQKDFKTDKYLYLLFVYFDEVRQKLNDYSWLIPSEQFRDAAEVVKSQNGEDSLKFEALIGDKKDASKDIYGKFLIRTKELGKIILNAFEKDGRIIFDRISSDTEDKVSLEGLSEFLVEARKDVYSINSPISDAPRLLASTQLEFQKGDYSYRNIYFSGDKKIIGQEILYKNAKPIWGMNYIGDSIGKLEFNFLKESLDKLAGKCRLGQNSEYEKRDFKYQDYGKGDIKDFSGKEELFLQSKSIYSLIYQGGLISEKQ